MKVRHSLPLAAGISLAVIYSLITVLYLLLPDVAVKLTSHWLGSGMHAMPEVNLMTWVKGAVNTFVLTYVVVALTQYVDAYLNKK